MFLTQSSSWVLSDFRIFRGRLWNRDCMQWTTGRGVMRRKHLIWILRITRKRINQKTIFVSWFHRTFQVSISFFFPRKKVLKHSVELCLFIDCLYSFFFLSYLQSFTSGTNYEAFQWQENDIQECSFRLKIRKGVQE